MNFKQFYLGCLAHASYYIGSDGEAAVIDPQRDVQQYLDEANANGQKIKYIIETHSHADFVSGHIELAQKTGAEIVYGAKADTAFPTLKVSDGDKLRVGSVGFEFRETPGHTPESVTVIARDESNVEAPLKMFTGDTLFCGDVGRPDLIGSKGFTSEEMGSMLYDSLRDKVLTYPDETEVYPAHGAGSLCGKSLSKETWSTLGAQRATNYALQPMTKDEFIKLVASDQPQVPAYFPKSAERNLAGPASIDDLPKPRAMSTDEISHFDGVVLDVRSAAEFGKAHVRNAINIGLSGQFATWAGTFIPVGTTLAIAAETEQQVEEAFVRLARVGLETVQGFILMADYSGELTAIDQVSVSDVNEISANGVQLVDVRQPGEYAGGHAYRASNLPLNSLDKNIERLDPSVPTYVICQSGYRSSLATSILENAGFAKVHNVVGGTKAWIDAGLETEREATACAG
ncbi:MAG TPA: rhodanese-like domain-containing protein [Pyrinomonadaceae bacterium]|nr:rhodanese-like domain-containing protein [Pyrinomonadaceae bacterium]